MAASMILGYTRTDGSTDANNAVLATYTGAGFCRAHVDAFDSTLVYLEPNDPLPAVQAAIAPVVTQFVSDNFTLTAGTTDPLARVLAIVQNTRVSLADWLAANVRDDIAQFLNDETRIRIVINAELIAQGILE